MITVEQTTEIAASPQQVWDLVSDLGRWNEWLTIHQKWKDDLPATPSQGSTFAGVASILNMPNTITWTVEEYEAPHTLAISGTGMAGATVHLALAVATSGQGATLSVRAGFVGQMVVGAIAGALERAANSELDASLTNLHTLLKATVA